MIVEIAQYSFLCVAIYCLKHKVAIISNKNTKNVCKLLFFLHVVSRNSLQITNKFCSFSIRRIMVLEFSQYLENYLWPNYKPGASIAHVLSIVIMLNEKFRERVQAWQVSTENVALYTCLLYIFLLDEVVYAK